MYNDDGGTGRLGDEDDDEVETIERNDAIFHTSFPTIARRDSDDDWDRVVESDFSFERSVSFHSEHLDDGKEDTYIGDEDVSLICFKCPIYCRACLDEGELPGKAIFGRFPLGGIFRAVQNFSLFCDFSGGTN